jgi:predicted nucleic acid-binding protein
LEIDGTRGLDVIVIDASAVLAIMFGEPDAALVVKALRDYPRAACIAPDLLVLEVANSVLMFRRRLPADRALSADGAFAFCTTEVLAQRVLEQLSSLGISLEPSTDGRNFTQLITLAESHRITSYDAAYLALAQARRATLLTLDQNLARAAMTLGVDAIPRS